MPTVDASHYCDHQWTSAGAIYYTNKLQFNKQSYTTSDSPNISGKVNDCNIDEIKIVIKDSCGKIVATKSSTVPTNQGDYQDSFWVQVPASDWYYSGTYTADASANGKQVSSTTMSFTGTGPQISSPSDPNCSKPKPSSSSELSPTKYAITSGGGEVSLGWNGASMSGDGYFVYALGYPKLVLEHGAGSAVVSIEKRYTSNVGFTCTAKGSFVTDFKVSGGVNTNGELFFKTYDASPSQFKVPLDCGRHTIEGGDYRYFPNPFSSSGTIKLDNSESSSTTQSMSISGGTGTWHAKLVEKASSSSSSDTSVPSSLPKSKIFQYSKISYHDQKFHQYSLIVSGITFKSYSTHKNSLNVWYTVSGSAASWITPQKLDFGMISPGEEIRLTYEIDPPSDIPPGNYEYVWNLGCNSALEDVVCTGKRIYKVTVEQLGHGAPPSEESSPSIAKDSRCPEGYVLLKTEKYEVCAETAANREKLEQEAKQNIVEPPSPTVPEIQEKAKPFFNAMFDGKCEILHNQWELLFGGSEIPFVCTNGSVFLPSGHLLKLDLSDDWDIKLGSWALEKTVKTALSSFPAGKLLVEAAEKLDPTSGKISDFNALSLLVTDGKGKLFEGAVEFEFSCPTGECKMWRLEKDNDSLQLVSMPSVWDKITKKLIVQSPHNSVYIVGIYSDEENVSKQTSTKSTPSSQVLKEKIPGWVKNNAKWWAEGNIGDSDFTSGIQHLIKEKIINIPDLPKQASKTTEEKIPDWIRNNAKWWADGAISEVDFLNGIKYLVEQGIVKVSVEKAAPTSANVKIPNDKLGIPGCEETNSCFIPYRVQIDVGGTVTWINEDKVPHALVSAIFDSDLILPGKSFKHTFTDAETVDYFCMIHPWETGIVLVN